MYHSNALLLPDGQVLTAGGGRAPGDVDYPNAQLYSPDYLSQPNRPVITGLQTPVWTAGSSINLTVSSANGLGSVVLMGLPAVTHGIDTSSRRLVLPITSAYNPASGAVAVQTPSITQAPAGHYYAIALDSSWGGQRGPHHPGGRRCRWRRRRRGGATNGPPTRGSRGRSPLPRRPSPTDPDASI